MARRTCTSWCGLYRSTSFAHWRRYRRRCRDGKDKSAFGILALHQVHYKMPYEDAMDALRARVACDGNNPLVHLKKIPK
jgi:hypothetical protein